jgi:hypothetical protein
MTSTTLAAVPTTVSCTPASCTSVSFFSVSFFPASFFPVSFFPVSFVPAAAGITAAASACRFLPIPSRLQLLVPLLLWLPLLKPILLPLLPHPPYLHRAHDTAAAAAAAAAAVVVVVVVVAVAVAVAIDIPALCGFCSVSQCIAFLAAPLLLLILVFLFVVSFISFFLGAPTLLFLLLPLSISAPPLLPFALSLPSCHPHPITTPLLRVGNLIANFTFLAPTVTTFRFRYFPVHHLLMLGFAAS